MIFFAIGGAVILSALAYLVWPWAGLGIKTDLPVVDKVVPFRFRPGSLLAKLLKRKAATKHQVVVLGVIHSSGYSLTEGEFLHELWHVLRERLMGWPKHIWGYLTSKVFRTQEESGAERFQHNNRGLPKILSVLDKLNQYGAQKGRKKGRPTP